MPEQRLRYSVELDDQSLQAQLSQIASGVTGGLNTAFAAGAGAIGTVSMASDRLRQDLGAFFAPPASNAAYYPSGSTHSLNMGFATPTFAPMPGFGPTATMGRMNIAGEGMQGQGFGLVQELDAATGGSIASIKRDMGKVAAAFGIRNRWGQAPRTMTDEDYQEALKESWEDRKAQFGESLMEVGAGATIGGVVGGAIGAAIGGFIGIAGGPAGIAAGMAAGGAKGATWGAMLLPAFMDKPLDLLDPGRSQRKMFSQTARAMGLGGPGGAMDREQREAFASTLHEQMQPLQNFFTDPEMQEGLVGAVSSGAIKLRQQGRSAQELGKEVKDYMAEIKSAMQNLHMEFEDAQKFVSQTRGRLGLTHRQGMAFQQEARQLGKLTGLSAGISARRMNDLADSFMSMGIDAPTAAGMVGTALTAMEAGSQTGYIDPYLQRRFGGAAGVAQAVVAGNIAFGQTQMGQAMSFGAFMSPNMGLGALSSGRMDPRTLMQGAAGASLEDVLRFKGSADIQANRMATSGIPVGIAKNILHQRGISDPDEKTLAGMITILSPGTDPAQARAMVKYSNIIDAQYDSLLAATRRVGKMDTKEKRVESLQQSIRRKAGELKWTEKTETGKASRTAKERFQAQMLSDVQDRATEIAAGAVVTEKHLKAAMDELGSSRGYAHDARTKKVSQNFYTSEKAQTLYEEAAAAEKIERKLGRGRAIYEIGIEKELQSGVRALLDDEDIREQLLQEQNLRERDRDKAVEDLFYGQRRALDQLFGSRAASNKIIYAVRGNTTEAVWQRSAARLDKFLGVGVGKLGDVETLKKMGKAGAAGAAVYAATLAEEGFSGAALQESLMAELDISKEDAQAAMNAVKVTRSEIVREIKERDKDISDKEAEELADRDIIKGQYIKSAAQAGMEAPTESVERKTLGVLQSLDKTLQIIAGLPSMKNKGG